MKKYNNYLFIECQLERKINKKVLIYLHFDISFILQVTYNV